MIRKCAHSLPLCFPFFRIFVDSQYGHCTVDDLNSSLYYATPNLLENERLNFELRIGTSYSHSLSDEVVIENFRKNVMQVQNQVLDEWEKVIVKETDNKDIS